MSLRTDKVNLNTQINRYMTLLSNLDNPPSDYINDLDYFKGLVQIANQKEIDGLYQTWEALRPKDARSAQYIATGVLGEGRAVELKSLIDLTWQIMTLRGGATSGNWGHSGRKGKRGGSGRGGGFKRIGVKPGTSRKKVKQAAKKKQSKSKPKAQAPKEPQAKKKPTSTGSKKLNDIFDKAPKSSEANFSNHLIDKMMKGEITLQEGQQLTKRFKGSQSQPKAKAPKTGNVKQAKTFSEAELKKGAAKRQWSSWNKSLTGNEKMALKEYASEPFDELGTDYIKMNSHLRGKDKSPSKETREAVRRVDKAINKGSLSQDTTVFRGFPASILGDDPSKIVGKTVTDKAYTSTSMSERIARQFSKDLIAEIKVPKGSKGAFMDATLSNKDLDQLGRDPEHELLLPRGSKFRIIGTKKIGDKTKVFMELVND